MEKRPPVKVVYIHASKKLYKVLVYAKYIKGSIYIPVDFFSADYVSKIWKIEWDTLEYLPYNIGKYLVGVHYDSNKIDKIE